GGRADRVVEIELVGGALARELAQAAQRHFQIARAELHPVVEIAELALLPDLDRGAVAAARPVLVGIVALAALPHFHAFGIVAAVAERRRAAGADPLVAALMAFLLFGEALFQQLHQLVDAAQRRDVFLFLLGEE